MEPIRTIVVDDEPESRTGMLELLGPDSEVLAVGEAGSGPEAVKTIQECGAELMFLDIQMPDRTASRSWPV